MCGLWLYTVHLTNRFSKKQHLVVIPLPKLLPVLNKKLYEMVNRIYFTKEATADSNVMLIKCCTSPHPQHKFAFISLMYHCIGFFERMWEGGYAFKRNKTFFHIWGENTGLLICLFLFCLFFLKRNLLKPLLEILTSLLSCWFIYGILVFRYRSGHCGRFA